MRGMSARVRFEGPEGPRIGAFVHGLAGSRARGAGVLVRWGGGCVFVW